MNVVVTGACGLLGAHLVAALGRHHRVLGIDRHPWWGDVPTDVRVGDLADERFRAACIAEAAPQLFIHCAAMVNVDACEDRPAEAYAINGALTGALARAVPRDCRFVYITTDGIFRGDRPMMREADLPCPRTVYGRSKLHGEWETAIATDEHLIIRTNFYGWSSGRKQSSAEWLYAALAAETPITLFDDFHFTPMYVLDLVERLQALVAGGHRGVFHVTGRDRVSKYEYGMRMAGIGALPVGHVRRGSIDAAPLKADRPRDMSLSAEQCATATGLPSPDCAAGLHRFVADRERTLSARVAALPRL